jgi:acyl carrier protein
MAIEQEIRQFIEDNFLMGATSKELKNEDSFLENGIIDSTGVLELVGFIEEHYEISVADEELVPENLDSIKNVAAYIQRKKTVSLEVAQ